MNDVFQMLDLMIKKSNDKKTLIAKTCPKKKSSSKQNVNV
jgi:hypothetical protein